CGYWGPNYVRVFDSLKNSKVQYCCDLEAKNLSKIKKICPSAKMERSYKKIATSSDVDAVVIATPLDKHYEIAKHFLSHKKHVLIEKPFTPTVKEGMELVEIAEKNKLTLMVGHVYEYNPGIQELKELIRKKKLGNVYYIHAKRIGLGPIRKYASALWDLATHDISVALYLLDELPEKVTAVGGSYIQSKVQDMVFVSMKFPSKIIFNVYASWIAPEKIRTISVIGSRAMVVFDDVNKSETLKIYDRQIEKALLDSTPEYSDHQLVVNMGDIHIPRIEQSEPLKTQAEHFLECIEKKRNPLTDGESSLKVVKVLEAAERSLKTGRAVKCR
ncbi:MAG: Gfo/Idh/MocA family oxidoreductase, partial [Candidatus Omnitrophota bacterium]